jgi:tRNA threonylcarbamoyl adenosine modification protein YeaZ
MPDSLAATAEASAGDWHGATLVIGTGHDLSLALLHDGVPAAVHHESMAKGHAEALMPAIAALLAPFGGAGHRCGRIVVETGPGSFTGLRVGLAAARALALAWGARLLGVRSTQLVAAETCAKAEGVPLLVALAAPRGQIWVEGFGAGALLPPQALLPEQARQLADRYARIAGTALLPRAQAPTPPHACAVQALAMSDLGGAEILYVRAPESADRPHDNG